MELTPQETAFLLDEMNEIEDDETRYPTVRVRAEHLREKAEDALTE